jgi:hypothetical protein
MSQPKVVVAEEMVKKDETQEKLPLDEFVYADDHTFLPHSDFTASVTPTDICVKLVEPLTRNTGSDDSEFISDVNTFLSEKRKKKDIDFRKTIVHRWWINRTYAFNFSI